MTGLVPECTGDVSLPLGYNVGWFEWSIFRIFNIIIFCFAVAMCDLVHDVEAIFHIP